MQLIRVRVSAGAKKNKIERLDETFLSVWVKAKPVRGQANEAVRALVAGHFGVPVAKVRIVRGRLSAHKIMEVMEWCGEVYLRGGIRNFTLIYTFVL